MCEKPCETCKKEGLPLLLTRYAVLPKEAEAPALSGNLNDAALAKVSLGNHAQYGLRLLRSGYVYVYDEARKNDILTKGWNEYFVTGDGFLTKLPPRPVTGSRPTPATEFACARNGAAPLAGVITIRNPKNATNIWMGFSDVEWTDDTLKKHNDAAYRDRHMTKIIVADGKVNPQPRTAPIEQVDALVPEFKLESPAVRKHIDPWTPFQFNSRRTQAQEFKAVVKAARPQGGAAMVTLMDPVSITAELDALMTYRFNVFANDPKRQRPLATSTMIQQLEEAIRAQGVDREEAAAEKVANDMAVNSGVAMLLSKRYREQVEEIRTVTPEQAKRAEDNAWASYQMDKTLFGSGKPRFNEKEMKAWQAQYEKELAAFDKEHIVPLATAHRDWMKCGAMTEYFACNFDEADVDNGLTYALAISLCIGGTQDKAVCFDLYTEWLDASTFDKSNLLLNAFALNLKQAKEALQKAADVNLNWSGLQWDYASNALKEILGGKWEAAAETISTRLVVRTMGPLQKVMAHSAAAGRSKLSLVTHSVYAGRPYTAIDVVGGKKAFRALLIKQLIKLSKQPLNEKQLTRAVAAEMRRLEIAGAKLDGMDKKRFLILLDETYLKGMPSNLNSAQRVEYAVKNFNTIEKIEKLEFDWQTKLGEPRGGLIKGAFPFAAGLLVALFQYYVMNQLGKDDEAAKTVESRWKLRAGIAFFAGTVAEAVGLGLSKAAPFIPKVAKGLNVLATGLKFGGRALGVVGALIVAVWDGIHASEAKKKGQYGMAILYGLSAGLGFAAAFLLAIPGFGWIALALVLLWMAVSIVIEYVKDNDIQKWLERCYWGNGPGERYPDLETEMQQLKRAVG
jgi:hypothetical protein